MLLTGVKFTGLRPLFDLSFRYFVRVTLGKLLRCICELHFSHLPTQQLNCCDVPILYAAVIEQLIFSNLKHHLLIYCVFLPLCVSVPPLQGKLGKTLPRIAYVLIRSSQSSKWKYSVVLIITPLNIYLRQTHFKKAHKNYFMGFSSWLY